MHAFQWKMHFQAISTRSPQLCPFSSTPPPLQQHCTFSHQSVKLLNVGATPLPWIHLRLEWFDTDHLVIWYSHNNLELNVLKAVEMTVDFRKSAASPAPHHPVWLPQVTLWSPSSYRAPSSPQMEANPVAEDNSDTIHPQLLHHNLVLCCN